jgi:hypothetical protein
MCVFALGAVPLVGCTEVFEPELVPLFVQTTGPESVTEDFGPNLEGVEVCQTGTTNCATTDINGEATLMLPANQVLSYTLGKEGYITRLHAVMTDETFDNEPFTSFRMLRDQTVEDLAEDLQIPYPLEGGWVTLQAFPGRAGATYELLSGTATAFYNNEAGIPTLDLTATTSGGLGVGGFLEVTAGEHQVEFGGNATNCVPDVAWPGDAANRIKFPVRVGHLIYARAVCESK